MVILDFSPDVFVCPKCTNGAENQVHHYDADKDREDSPKMEHLEMECHRCGYKWISKCAEVDIEQEWSDLDLFTKACPKCRDGQLEMKYCGGYDESEKPSRRCDLDPESLKGEEHLHCKCQVCSFEWNSVVADKEVKPEAKPS